MATLTMTDVQKCALTLAAKDAKGNAATLPSPPSWTVSDPTLLTVTPSADGLSAEIAAVGPEGNCQVNVSADLGGGQTVTGSLAVTITGSAAATISVTPGTPS